MRRFAVRRRGQRVAGERRGLLVSRVWVQATLLVVVCGFFILGLLAYRTYMAHPPVPKRVVDSQGRVLYTGRGHSEGPTGLPAQRAHGVRLRIWSRCVPRARLHRRLPAPLLRSRQALVRRSRVGFCWAQDDHGPAHKPLRRDDEDADADVFAGVGLPPPRSALQPVLLGADDRARPAPRRDHRSCGAAPADGFLRVDGLGRVDQSTRARLLLHEQLAARAARR